MRSRKTFGKVLLVILLGALFGTLLGELLGLVLPDGVVKEFFIRSWAPEFGPATLNLVIFSLTFGLSLKVNISGVIGIFIAIYVLRWY